MDVSVTEEEQGQRGGRPDLHVGAQFSSVPTPFPATPKSDMRCVFWSKDSGFLTPEQANPAMGTQAAIFWNSTSIDQSFRCLISPTCSERELALTTCIPFLHIELSTFRKPNSYHPGDINEALTVTRFPDGHGVGRQVAFSMKRRETFKPTFLVRYCNVINSATKEGVEVARPAPRRLEPRPRVCFPRARLQFSNKSARAC